MLGRAHGVLRTPELSIQLAQPRQQLGRVNAVLEVQCSTRREGSLAGRDLELPVDEHAHLVHVTCESRDNLILLLAHQRRRLQLSVRLLARHRAVARLVRRRDAHQ